MYSISEVQELVHSIGHLTFTSNGNNRSTLRKKNERKKKLNSLHLSYQPSSAYSHARHLCVKSQVPCLTPPTHRSLPELCPKQTKQISTIANLCFISGTTSIYWINKTPQFEFFSFYFFLGGDDHFMVGQLQTSLFALG